MSNKLSKWKEWVSILLASISSILSAHAYQPILTTTAQGKPSFFSSYVLTLSGGPTWTNGGTSQTLNLTSDIQKSYQANNSASAIGQIELFLGFPFLISTKLHSQLGLALATTSSATLSGHILDDALPQFENYTYQYHLRHSQITLKGKLLTEFYSFQPWISANIGAGFNRASSFTNTALIYQALPSPNFKSNTTTALTYGFGVGIEIPLTKHLQMGLGYEFQNWGRSQLAPAPQQTTKHGLSLSHFYTNSFLGNITYLS